MTPSLDHDPDQLIRLFNSLFANDENTVLVRGGDEPLYLPACDATPAQVIFAHGYYASAMHEIAHWCVAGPARRKLEDYGYWYEPDGRTQQQQQLFEAVEYKPQALEWILCKAAGFRFRISVDNLSGEPTDPKPFADAVYAQVGRYLRVGYSVRAQRLVTALQRFYGREGGLSFADFAREELC